jgi:hypothetical protein
LKAFGVLIGAILLAAAGANASPLPANFVFAEIPPNTTQVTLPYLLDNVNDTVFLKFRIPDIANVVSIQSFTINLALFDDGDGGGETGTFVFALPGTNLTLASFFGNLNRTTIESPAVFPISLDSSQIAQVFPSLQDGTFRIKILRDTGDFFVEGATVSIDATMAPEPGSLLLAFSAISLVALRKFNR